MNTAIYMRVSTEEQAKEGYSLAAQKRKLLAYCDAKDWTVTAIYCDEGISGSSISARPQATQMLEDAKKHLFENILILKVDRLCRNTRDLLEIVDLLKKHNIKLNATEEQIDYTTPTGKMLLTMLGSFAELERSTITERMLLGKEQMARQGKYIRGPIRPFGYRFEDDKIITVPDEAIAVKQWIKWLYEGKSYRWICSENIRRKINTSTGNNGWDASHISNILHNPVLAGFAHFKRANGTKILAKCCDIENPILSVDEFNELQLFLGNRGSACTRKYAKTNYWFADVLYCGHCGHKLTTNHMMYTYKPTGKTYEKFGYRCQFKYRVQVNVGRCPSQNRNQSTVERFFIDYCKNLLLPPAKENKKMERENELAMNTRNQLEKSIQKNRNKKKRLLDLYLEGSINSEDYKAALDELIDENKSIENQLSELDNKKMVSDPMTTDQKDKILNFAKIVVTTWEILNDVERRELISKGISKMFLSNDGITKIEFN